MRRRRYKKAFSLVEILVVIGIISLLLGFLLPAIERIRHRAYIDSCASNLRQVGQALFLYANDNNGLFPRTTYVPGAPVMVGTGGAATDPFAANGPAANDITAAIWLLIRDEQLPTSLLICPYDDVNEFQADPAPSSSRSNFTDYEKNLGYSYANPYPDASAATLGYHTGSRLGATFAVMADLNPGVSDARQADPFRPTPTSSQTETNWGNSGNHEREGQNVLFGDGHVTFEVTPFCGMNRDNIYTGQTAAAPNLLVSPGGPADSLLLPTN